MIATAFDEENGIASKPPSMGADECAALSIFSGFNTDGVPVVISCWKITKEELEEFNRTGRIWLIVCGKSMPPVALTAVNPFK